MGSDSENDESEEEAALVAKPAAKSQGAVQAKPQAVAAAQAKQPQGAAQAKPQQAAAKPAVKAQPAKPESDVC